MASRGVQLPCESCSGSAKKLVTLPKLGYLQQDSLEIGSDKGVSPKAEQNTVEFEDDAVTAMVLKNRQVLKTGRVPSRPVGSLTEKPSITTRGRI